jgi:hypothetical protein
MAVTYFCTDSKGNTYWRCSAGHGEPHYTYAAILLSEDGKPVRKNCVNYSATERGARTLARQYAHRGAYEVVPLRAYKGRLKVEPVREPSDDEVDAGVLAGLKEQKTFRQHIQAALASDEEVGLVETQIEPTDEGFEVYVDGSAKGVFPTLEAAEAFALRRRRGF